jgi:hypothetical protein
MCAVVRVGAWESDGRSGVDCLDFVGEKFFDDFIFCGHFYARDDLTQHNSQRTHATRHDTFSSFLNSPPHR